MSKYKKRKDRKLHNVVVCAVMLVAVLIVLSVFVKCQCLLNSSIETAIQENGLNQEQDEINEKTDLNPEETKVQARDAEIEFPVLSEDGRVEVESIFPFSGVNPDADNQEVTDVAAIVIENKSDFYLSSAIVKAVFSDGSEQTFMIFDLPAGKSMMAFSVDNLTWEEDNICVDLSIEAAFENNEECDDVITIVDGMTITLENISDKDLLNVDVYCHEVLNDRYFGGIAYRYFIDKIPVGESVSIIATDSILGVVDVVRITADNQK